RAHRLWQIVPVTVTVDAVPGLDLHSEEGSIVGGGTRAVAHIVLFLSLSLAAASLVLVAMIRPSWTEDQWYFVVDVAAAAVIGVVAWLLLARTGHPVSWLIALSAVGGGLAALGSQCVQYRLVHTSSPGLELLSFMQVFGSVPGTRALFTIVPY